MTAGDLFSNTTTPFLGLRLSGNDVHLSIRTTGVRSLTRTPTTTPKHRLTTPVLGPRLLGIIFFKTTTPFLGLQLLTS